MLIGLPDFSYVKIFTFQCFKSVTPLLSKNDNHQLLPYFFKRQPQAAHQLSLLLQAALVQINEGLYFRSPRLATRFESKAANIAKLLVRALFNLIINFNIQENQAVKNSQDHNSSVFSLKVIVKITKNPLRQAYIPPCFLQPIVWFLSFRTVPKTAPKSPNSSASVLKTSSHKPRRWKTAKR